MLKAQRIPETKRITFEKHSSDTTTVVVGAFLVTVGRKTGKVGTVYHVASVREMKRSKPHRVKYMLEVFKATDMLPLVHRNPHSGRVWVGDDEAITMHWNPREPKKKTSTDKSQRNAV